MSVIQGASPAAGLYGLLFNAGAPVNGTDEVQRITIGGTPTGGTFTLTFDGYTTGAITWSATTNTLLTNVETALEALPNIDGVTVADNDLSSGIGSFDVTFSGSNVGKRAVALMTADVTSLTGTSPTVTPAEQTAGVDATHRNAALGAVLLDTTNNKKYINVGSSTQAPDWQQYAGGPFINVISETVAFDDFTDNTDTTGYVDLADSLPAGAIPLAWKAVVATGFTGDTTAVLQVGVSGDLDRFSAVTDQSVLAAGTVGASALGRSDSLDGIAAAQTIRLTVTGAADFTSISAGSMTISFYYVEL